MGDILNLLAIIVIFGIAMWLINAFIPMPGMIKSLLNLVVLIILVLYALQFFGIVDVGLPMIKIFK